MFPRLKNCKDIRKLALLAIIVLFVEAKVLSQSCLHQGITFATQEQIDNFQTNYPGCTEIEGDVSINGSDIINLNGLSVLSSVGNWLEIGGIYDGNPILTDLSGLENLESIGGPFYIYSNDSLSDISALSSLTFVDGDLRIEYNPYLTTLVGLDNIDAESINLISISGNSTLTTCEVQSVCDYLASPYANIYIHNNMTGCNNKEEVISACQEVSILHLNYSPFTIYPNPTKGQIIVSCESEQNITEINIYDQFGQKVLHKTIVANKINISALDQGLYVIEIVSDNLRIRKKIIHL